MTDAARTSTRSRFSPAALLAASAVLVSAAFLSLLVVAATDMDGYDWDEGSLVPMDGQPHVVAMDGGRTGMLWAEFSRADGTVEDASGAPLPLAPTDGARERAAGWMSEATFEPRSDRVEVTCAPVGEPPSRAAVDNAPRVPSWLDGWGPWALLPVTLALAGALALLTAIAVLLRRR